MSFSNIFGTVLAFSAISLGWKVGGLILEETRDQSGLPWFAALWLGPWVILLAVLSALFYARALP